MSASIRAGATDSALQQDGIDAVQFDANGLKIEAFNDGVITGAKLASDVPFRKGFTSAEQVITSAGSLSIAHGLGVTPILTQCSLVCKVAEHGYSIGDDIEIHAGNMVTTRGLSINRLPTIIEVTFGTEAAALYYINKTTGGTAALTNTSWRLIVRAFA